MKENIIDSIIQLMNLKDKVAVVTGGALGIGEVVCVLLRPEQRK